jgi:hypothetical protein
MDGDRGERMNKSIEARFMAKVRNADNGHWLYAGACNPAGYGVFSMNGKSILAHRASYILFNGDIPDGKWVLHKPLICKQTRNCVNPEHLYLGTLVENTRDKEIDGTNTFGDRNGLRMHPERIPRGDRNGARTRPDKIPRGEDRHNSKLTPEGVKEIRELRLAGKSNAEIASMFGRSWRHVA